MDLHFLSLYLSHFVDVFIAHFHFMTPQLECACVCVCRLLLIFPPSRCLCLPSLSRSHTPPAAHNKKMPLPPPRCGFAHAVTREKWMMEEKTEKKKEKKPQQCSSTTPTPTPHLALPLSLTHTRERAGEREPTGPWLCDTQPNIHENCAKRRYKANMCGETHNIK